MTRNINEKVIYLRKFFEVYHLDLLNEAKLAHIACRRSGISEKADYALLAWAQKAKLEARTITVSPINLRKLKSALSEIRKMTLMAPEVFCKKLQQILSECGIALVFLPHIGGSFLHGATFYDMNKIVIGLTVRGKDADKFWFSLFLFSVNRSVYPDRIVHFNIYRDQFLLSEPLLQACVCFKCADIYICIVRIRQFLILEGKISPYTTGGII